MASCSRLIKQSRCPLAGSNSNSGVLPPDVLFEVLLLLPAKELCRLRVVCHSWRCLTSDPLFIEAHTARQPGPLFLASFRDDNTHIDIIDLSGDVVKRIANTDGHMVLCPRLELACVATENNYCHVLNPATGTVYVLPESPTEQHVHRKHLGRPYTSFAFGRVASTGEYKVLRMFNRINFDDIDGRQLCEVFTISGGAVHDSWRGKQNRAILVEANTSIIVNRVFYELSTSVVVNEVVYFLMDSVYHTTVMDDELDTGTHPDSIASFDLMTEEWREDIQGPISSNFVGGGDDDSEYPTIWSRLTLAELKGYLVLVYHRHWSTTDMWILTDFSNGAWLKEYSIKTESAIPANEYFVKPLLLLNDGRIVIHLVWTGLLVIYDPRINTFTELEMRNLDTVGLYTGSLLRLQNGDMV